MALGSSVAVECGVEAGAGAGAGAGPGQQLAFSWSGNTSAVTSRVQHLTTSRYAPGALKKDIALVVPSPR